MGRQEDDRTVARDFVMARLAACRAALVMAEAALDECLVYFVDPSDDARGKERGELLEAVDAQLGEAARAIQLAQQEWVDVDPEGG